MFYSHFHLKKTGRFGLIWLAATQSKVLSKREIIAVNIRGSCDDIVKHIPVRSGGQGRASRFSLYLCCQLLYGSVKVLQRQWDYLLVDVSACYKRCVPECHGKEIELGAPRESDRLGWKAGDIIQNTLESNYKGDDLLIFEKIPFIVQPEIGSPHSVSDPRMIQIPDLDTSQLSITLPDEPDLPRLDHAALMELLSPVRLSAVQEVEGPHFFQNPAPEILEMQCDNTSLPEGNMLSRVGALEETPLSKPGSSMPAPPRKPRPGAQRKTKPRTDTDHQRDDTFENAPQDQDILFTDSVVAVSDPMAGIDDPKRAQTEDQMRVETERQPRSHRHDWEQKNPPAVQLSPAFPEQSPLRKKRPHKLIIDTSLMTSKVEMREHMKNTEDIISPMILPLGNPESRHFYKEPAHNFLHQNKELNKLFTRNCKFGLRMEDSGSERDSSSSSPTLLDILMKRKRTRQFEDEEPLPSKIPRPSEELPSIEHGRDASSRFLHSFDIERNLSHSIIAQSGDESTTSVRSRRHPSLLQDKDISGNNSMLVPNVSVDSALLPVWPEEPELNVSAVPIMGFAHEQPQETVAQNADLIAQYQQPMQPDSEKYENGAEKSPDENHSDGVLKLIKHHLRTYDDMTTFRGICPPSQYSMYAAASFFSDLCYQISKQRVFVRQDEPYDEIYIWLPQES